jgi:hypothetical protein
MDPVDQIVRPITRDDANFVGHPATATTAKMRSWRHGRP